MIKKINEYNHILHKDYVTIFFSKLYRYGQELNTHDLVKVIAILLMIVDHVGEYLFADNVWCRLIGRGAAPLFFFLVGYVGKLHIRSALIVFGLILTFSTYLVSRHYNISILFNFILIHYCLAFFPVEKINTLTRTICFIAFALLNVPIYLFFEYGLLGILIAYSARMIALKDPQGDFWLLLTMILYFLWECAYFQFTKQPNAIFVFTLLTIFLIAAMQTYRLRQVPCPQLLRLPALFISRYSLEIYFFHLIILQIYFYLHTRF